MSPSDLDYIGAFSVRDSLITAADRELVEHGSLCGRFEAVARRAGVSRATAYRQLGSVTELLTQVGLRRAGKYITGLRDVMDKEVNPLAQLEAAMVYGARELPNDPLVLDLISRNCGAIVDPEVHLLITDLMDSVVTEGQRSGQLRADISRDEVLKYLIEQSYLATHAFDRSEWAVRRRFRLFIAPTLSPSASYVPETSVCRVDLEHAPPHPTD